MFMQVIRFFSGLKTYANGIATLITAALVGSGQLSPELQDASATAIIDFIGACFGLVMVFHGLYQIFIRLAIAKTVAPVDNKTAGPANSSVRGVLFMLLLCGLAIPYLTACGDKTKRFTDGNGNPIVPMVPPKVCVDTGDGVLCYEKKAEPPPPPPPPPIATASLLPARKDYTPKPLEK